MSETPTALLAAAAIAAWFALAVLAGWHVWYAIALSRLLAVHESAPWRAWVPVLNEAELLRLGGQDPAKAALLLVPLVNVYVIVLRALAAARIGRDHARPPGLVALAVVLPPLWATLVVSGAAPAAPTKTPETDAETAGAGAGARAAAPAPIATLVPSPAFSAGAAGAAPVPAAPIPPAAARALAPPTAAPAPAAPPLAPVAPASAPTSAAPQPPAPAPAVPPLTRREAAAARAETPAAEAGWALTLPDGQQVALTARRVLLGRNPAAEADAQLVAVRETSRTVSKRHALLDWDGERWTITDLASTNGVSVTDAAGLDRPLPAGGSAPVGSGFRLGDAVLVLGRRA